MVFLRGRRDVMPTNNKTAVIPIAGISMNVGGEHKNGSSGYYYYYYNQRKLTQGILNHVMQARDLGDMSSEMVWKKVRSKEKKCVEQGS